MLVTKSMTTKITQIKQVDSQATNLAANGFEKQKDK